MVKSIVDDRSGAAVGFDDARIAGGDRFRADAAHFATMIVSAPGDPLRTAAALRDERARGRAGPGDDDDDEVPIGDPPDDDEGDSEDEDDDDDDDDDEEPLQA